MIRWEWEPLKTHTTFRIGGPARYYLVPEKEEEVKEALQYAGEKGLPCCVIGKGSNVLFPDRGFDGVVIEIGKGMENIHISEEGKVTAQAGISLAKMASELAQAGLSGFEFAAGIPGTLGGGITMNAGAYGGEMRDCLVRAKVLTPDGNVRILQKDEMELGYRTSIIQKQGCFVLEGEFAFSHGDTGLIQEKMKELNGKRREKQPLEYPSAGSTFKRPEGFFAGKLIEDAGLRGYRVGDAQVSEKHCGFVINRGHATAEDVVRLIRDVQTQVEEKFGVVLEPEVRMIGF